MKRWPLILLIVSLVVNVFLVGAIAGSLWRWTHGEGNWPHAGWRAHAADVLPRPQAAALRRTMRGAVLASLPTIREGRAARAAAARLFVQPQFDAAAVTAALDQARAADTGLRANIEHQLVDFAARLPQDQRTKLAEALKAGPLHPPHQFRSTDRP